MTFPCDAFIFADATQLTPGRVFLGRGNWALPVALDERDVERKALWLTGQLSGRVTDLPQAKVLSVSNDYSLKFISRGMTQVARSLRRLELLIGDAGPYLYSKSIEGDFDDDVVRGFDIRGGRIRRDNAYPQFHNDWLVSSWAICLRGPDGNLHPEPLIASEDPAG